ncbi:hypothetical protein [Azospirillum rugosum]|uniref:Uncharacterized protein n=2 Tax=Azospirillum rugosum TaxID=416170 RepID=A0ABS4SXA9_9PROT|nr:hypothetical protein [Azospirillum rugosum]MBP2297196.1 hypothetical protein [Azospirillum rugosum]
MTDPDDLFEMYRSDRGNAPALKGDALANALADAVRRTFAAIDRLIAEVAQALSQARYTIRLAPSVVDRGSYVQLDRASESFRDYLRLWSHQRAESRGGGMHWEARILVADSRRQSAEIGLGVTIEWPTEWPTGAADATLAFVEFWTTGQGVSLPSEDRAFQRALVACILRLEEAGALTSAAKR